MGVRHFIVLFTTLFIASREVGGAPSWPSWATQVNFCTNTNHKCLPIKISNKHQLSTQHVCPTVKTVFFVFSVFSFGYQIMNQTKTFFCIFPPEHPSVPKRHQVYSPAHVEWGHIWILCWEAKKVIWETGRNCRYRLSTCDNGYLFNQCG